MFRGIEINNDLKNIDEIRRDVGMKCSSILTCFRI